MAKMVIYIDGMMCNNCAKHVTDALLSIDGINKCKVSLKDKCATINTSIDINKRVIEDAISNIGYNVTSIK